MPANEPPSMDPHHPASGAAPGSMSAAAGINARSASIEMVVIKADGTRIPVGTVAAYHRNPLIRAWREWKARRNLARFYRAHPEHRPQEAR